MKKNINLIALLLSIMVTTQSCKKYLDTVPTDFLSPANYYKTEAQLNVGLTGIYDILGRQGLYQRYYPFELNSSNDIDYWRNNRTTGPHPSFFNALASDTYITAAWNTLYDGVNRANNFLAAVDDSPAADSVKTPLKAQAQFLRGYYYFLLVSNWGAIPLRLKPTSSIDDAQCPRSSIKDVYAQVLKDMTEAEAGLPTIAQVGSAAGIRVTKTVAQGLLARICLYMAGFPLKDASKFAESAQWAQKVIKSGEHSLNPDYRQVFINQCADVMEPKESMWEVDFYITPSNGTEWGTNGIFNSISCRNIPWGFSYGNYSVSKKMWDIVTGISVTDLRRDWNMAPYTLGGSTTTIEGVTKAYLTQTVANIWGRYGAKWRREYDERSNKAQGVSPINWPILRYADVLLMFAEAENEAKGMPTDSAYWAINQVRERAQGLGNRLTGFTVTNAGSGYTSAPTVTVSSPTTGNGVMATATVSEGKVTAVALHSITNLNAFYTAQPTITFSGGGGTGATATAVMVPIDPTSADVARGLSYAQFNDEVRNERAVELCQEGFRRSDLIRWGIFIQTMQQFSAYVRSQVNQIPSSQYVAIPGDNISAKDNLFPIPNTEMTLNRALGGVNNPGY